jgi:hypothetical protein
VHHHALPRCRVLIDRTFRKRSVSHPTKKRRF